MHGALQSKHPSNLYWTSSCSSHGAHYLNKNKSLIKTLILRITSKSLQNTFKRLWRQFVGYCHMSAFSMEYWCAFLWYWWQSFFMASVFRSLLGFFCSLFFLLFVCFFCLILFLLPFLLCFFSMRRQKGQLSRPTQESIHVVLQLVKAVAWLNNFQPAFTLELTSTTWKVSVFGVILVLIFPYSDWIQRHTECLSIFSPNVGKYWSG